VPLGQTGLGFVVVSGINRGGSFAQEMFLKIQFPLHSRNSVAGFALHDRVKVNIVCGMAHRTLEGMEFYWEPCIDGSRTSTLLEVG